MFQLPLSARALSGFLLFYLTTKYSSHSTCECQAFLGDPFVDRTNGFIPSHAGFCLLILSRLASTLSIMLSYTNFGSPDCAHSLTHAHAKEKNTPNKWCRCPNSTTIIRISAFTSVNCGTCLSPVTTGRSDQRNVYYEWYDSVSPAIRAPSLLV